jgi:hypothetical protein
MHADNGLELGYLLGIDTFLGVQSDFCVDSASAVFTLMAPASGRMVRLFKISLLFMIEI